MNQTASLYEKSRALHVFAQLKQMQNFHESKSVPLHV